MKIRNLKGTLFSFLLLGIGSLVNSQELLPTMLDTTVANHQLNISGNVFHHSTSLTNEFTGKFLFGGEISEELAQKTFDKQRVYNRMGGGYHLRGEYRGIHEIFKNSPNWSWMIELSNELHAYGEYAENLMGLALLGNEPYLGERITLSGTEVRLDQFYTIGGGIHNKKTKSFITLNLVLPQNYFELNARKTYISFSENGDEITADIDGYLRRANKDAFFKGAGVAVNFDFNIPFGKQEGFNGYLGITARNLGFYGLHESRLSKVETSKSFTGFSFDDLLGDDGFPDLLDSIKVYNSTGNKYKVMPGFFQVGKIVTAHSEKKLQSFFGVRMYATQTYRPMVYAGLHYRPISQFSFGAQGSYGGYGNFRLGLYANYTTDSFIISAGTEDVLGLMLKSQFGRAAVIRVGWKF
ncbi:MAG TPA: hypothetical protein VL021_09890 [Brumimicrobium sp.]|nr:hypothetical protein [Brumimicrobium sp.]